MKSAFLPWIITGLVISFLVLVMLSYGPHSGERYISQKIGAAR